MNDQFYNAFNSKCFTNSLHEQDNGSDENMLVLKF